MKFPKVSETTGNCADLLTEVASIAQKIKATDCMVVLFKDGDSKTYKFGMDNDEQWIQAVHNITLHYYLGVDVN